MIVQGRVHLKPTKLLKTMRSHRDPSEGSKERILAKRIILGVPIIFYENGRREIDIEINEEEVHNSEVLRFAHASVLTEQPCGDKRICWVDATSNPVEVWLYGRKVTKELVRRMANNDVLLDHEFLDQDISRDRVEKCVDSHNLLASQVQVISSKGKSSSTFFGPGLSPNPLS